MKADGTSIDSLLIVRNGYLVLDAYFSPYDDSIPHNLASVTKSVTTSLIGIAVDQGKIQLDETMVSFFPDRTTANLDARKERVTVRHLASMTNGLLSGCERGDEETLDAMEENPDWVQAALDRKMAHEPGESFCYDSPGMHLLSAILQQATGMTELDFARQYLFEPLGIQEVIWESDPQGYTHGWGDLFLKPRDAAKIGYLWLNGGAWEGEQIVSPTWVADSVEALSHAEGEGYGYGWWVAGDSYYAAGRGGQYIRVYPSLNTIVVMTAGGADYSQVEPTLAGALVDPDKSLPANPAGVADLEATLAAMVQSPHPWPVGPLPEMASTISGKTYTFESNEVDLASLRLEFSGPAEAKQVMRLEGADVLWPIGLDGEYRVSSEGQGCRGYWADAKTFVVEMFDVGLSTFHLRFEDDRLEISSPELGLQIEGQVENP
jgi:CubicO group peptidase (beta-lactamase class C family)